MVTMQMPDEHFVQKRGRDLQSKKPLYAAIPDIKDKFVAVAQLHEKTRGSLRGPWCRHSGAQSDDPNLIGFQILAVGRIEVPLPRFGGGDHRLQDVSFALYLL